LEDYLRCRCGAKNSRKCLMLAYVLCISCDFSSLFA